MPHTLATHKWFFAWQIRLGEGSPKLKTRPWLRFDDYTIVNGVVRPAADADGHWYDPWSEYETTSRRGVRDKQPPPCQDLVKLWNDVSAGDEDGGYLLQDVEQVAALRTWCRRHGLLGLWHHEVLLALFPEQGRDGGRRLHGYERVSWRWREVRPWAELPPSGRSRGLRAPAELLAGLPRDVWREALPMGGFVLRELGTGAVSCAPLDAYWRLHFDPDGPLGKPVWPVPSPDSMEFMRAYGEPVPMIMYAARELDFAVRYGGSSGPAGLVSGAHEMLNALAVPASPALTEDEGALVPGIDSPSLLATLATTVMTELAGGARSVVCPVCGRAFTAKVRHATYCPDGPCKETAHTRRRREKNAK